MIEFNSFARFVNTELPTRVSTADDPLALTAKKIPVSTGQGLAVTFVTPETFRTQVLGLGEIDNTSDLDKPVSLATQEALDEKLGNEDVRGQLADLLETMGFTVDPISGDLILDEGEL